MKCEICQQQDATVHFKQVHNGEVRELRVCTHCAEANGFSVQSPMSLTDFLFGVGPQSELDLGSEDRTCPACGMSLGEMRRRSRLGCAVCYEAFSEEMAMALDAMQKGDRHVGKAPETEVRSREVLALEKAMDAAIVAQDFEEAALLRDRIGELREQQGVRSRDPMTT